MTTAPPGSYTGLDDYGHQSTVSNDSNCDNDESLDVLTRKFLCKIRGENRLTGKAVQNIAVATGHFMQQMLASVKRNVGDILQNADIINEEDLENIARVFNDTAQKAEVLKTPSSETFSNRSNYCGLDKIVSNITFFTGTAIILTTCRLTLRTAVIIVNKFFHCHLHVAV